LRLARGFQTISPEAFNPLATLFFINNKKGIIDSLIQDPVNSKRISLLIYRWWGKLDYNKNSKNKSLVLNTQNFRKLKSYL
jgi:hypothetical protein